MRKTSASNLTLSPLRRQFLLTAASAAVSPAMSQTPASPISAAASAPATPAHLAGNNEPFTTQPWSAERRVDAGSYTVERLSFQSQGVPLVGNLFVPQGQGRKPAVVLIGPVAYVKEQAPLQYATRLAREGIVALIFDARFHGESGGLPRRFESRQAKVEDLRAAVDYLASRPEVDAEQLHLVGVCQGVNWAAEASIDHPRVRSVALIAGHYLMPETAMLYLGSSAAVAARLERAEQARKRFEATGEVEYIPIVSLTDREALLTPRPIHDFYYRWADRGPFAGHTGLWENRITRMSELDVWGHRVEPVLARVTRPLLMIHSERAASGPQIPRALFERVGSRDKEAVWIPGRNQIQFYQDPITIDAAVAPLKRFVMRNT